MMSSHTNHDILDRVVSSFKVRIVADHVNFFVTAVASADASTGVTHAAVASTAAARVATVASTAAARVATAFSGRTS